MNKFAHGWRETLEYNQKKSLEFGREAYKMARAESVIKGCDTFQEFLIKSGFGDEEALYYWDLYVDSTIN